MEHFDPENLRNLSKHDNLIFYPYGITLGTETAGFFLIPILEDDPLFTDSSITKEDCIEKIIMREESWVYYKCVSGSKKYYFHWCIVDDAFSYSGLSPQPTFFIPRSLAIHLDDNLQCQKLNLELFKKFEKEILKLRLPSPQVCMKEIPSQLLAELIRKGHHWIGVSEW